MMETVLNTFIHFILCGFDVFMSFSFYRSMFRRSDLNGWRLAGIFLLTWGSIYSVNLLGKPTLNFLIVPICYFVFSSFVFKISIQKRLVYTLIYYVIFACLRELAFEMVFRLIREVRPQLSIKLFPPYGMFFLVIEYILSFFLLLYIEKYTRKLELTEDSNSDWHLLILPFASVLILFIFFYVEYPQQRKMQILMCSGAILQYFSNAVVFVILADLTRAMNKVKTAELVLLKKDMDKNHFDSIEKTNTVYRKYMHDIHQYFNQLRNLAISGENELIVNIIDNVEGKISEEKQQSLYTDSPVFNSILSEYKNRAEAGEIETKIFIEEGIKMDFIEDDDKISLFSNLLENAVEAAGKCEPEKRKMNVNLYMGNDYMLVFEIENTWLMSPFKNGTQFLSTKSNPEDHGLGIGIVTDLAEKYGGTLELTSQNEWFVTTLIMSCKV